MNSDHSYNRDATYRGVIAGARLTIETTARNADQQTQATVASIFDSMLSVFDVIANAKNQAVNVALQNPDLNDAAIERKYRPIITSAVSEARAAMDRAAANIAKLEKTLAAATKPSMPGGSDVQMQLLNMKNDFKMLFDSIPAAALLDTMVEELEGRIRAGDQVGIFLLGADRWPALYLQSRNEPAQAMRYSQRAAAAMRPLQSDLVQGQAAVLNSVYAPGRNGLKSLLVNLEGYLSQAISELEASNAHSWSTDAFNRY